MSMVSLYIARAVGTALRCASLRGARFCQLGSLRSQPNDRSLHSLIMQLVTPGHSWSQIVTNTYYVALLVPWLLVDTFGLLVIPGHRWSQLVTKCSMVTTGHKMFLGHRWSHWSQPCLWVGHYKRDIGGNGKTHGRSPLIL